MSAPPDEARLALQKARAALRSGQLNQARQWAEQAASLAPQMEDPWLVLAAVASPPASLQYVRRALKINPESALARSAMEWAMERLRQPDRLGPDTEKTASSSAGGPSPVPPAKTEAEPAVAQAPGKQRSRPKPVWAAILLGLGCIVLAVAAWSTDLMPVAASIIQRVLILAAPTQPLLWAPVSIPKPTYTPQGPSSQGSVGLAAAAPEVLPTSAAYQLNLPRQLLADQPTATAAVLPTAPSEPEASISTAEPTWSGALSMETVPDTPTAEIPADAAAPTGDSAGTVADDGEHWIDVNLTQETVNAYAGESVVNSFLASTGKSTTPTVTGTYHIYIKLLLSDLSGPDYFLPDVPYVMYFYKDYGLHGTYWHNDFGTPVSHGCVNLSIPDAEWLYNFSSVGTLVDVHY